MTTSSLSEETSVNGSARIRPLSFNHSILLFDGVCNLCNGFVNFVIDHDKQAHFRFGTLQHEPARSFLWSAGHDPDALDSIILVEKGRIYRESTAALRVLGRLGIPWAPLSALLVIPRPVRDAAYRWVANNRYEWYGKRTQCRVPTDDLKERFLDPNSVSPSGS